MTRRWAGEWTAEDGLSLVEVLLVAVLAMSLAGLAVPLTAQAGDTSVARSAAGFLASRVRAARQQAVAGNRAVAMVFEHARDDWSFRLCADGNGNGVRRADIASGRDACDGSEYVVSRMFSGIRLTLDPGVPTLDEELGGSEGVRFGSSSMASCSALGHCSPGTFYLRSPRGQQFAVRVAGVTGRTRILRFDTGRGAWVVA